MPTLAELRASKAAALPTHVERLCLNTAIMADYERLQNERRDLEVEHLRSREAAGFGDDEGDRPKGPPAKSGQKPPKPSPRIAEIDEELEALYDRMRADEGELLLQAVDGATWQAWKDDNPPRIIGHKETRRGEGADAEVVTGDPIYNADDLYVARGHCNYSALLADLGRYAVAWDGEQLADGDWQMLARKIAPGDLRVLAVDVIELHEGSGFRAPKATTSPSDPTSGSAGS